MRITVLRQPVDFFFVGFLFKPWKRQTFYNFSVYLTCIFPLKIVNFFGNYFQIIFPCLITIISIALLALPFVIIMVRWTGTIITLIMTTFASNDLTIWHILSFFSSFHLSFVLFLKCPQMLLADWCCFCCGLLLLILNDFNIIDTVTTNDFALSKVKQFFRYTVQAAKRAIWRSSGIKDWTKHFDDRLE